MMVTVNVPVDTSEMTAGLLGAKIDPVRFAFGIDGKHVTEVRLLEIERRILLIETRLADLDGDD
jgi:hypothetical protein